MRETKAMYERLLALTQDINQKHGIGYFKFASRWLSVYLAVNLVAYNENSSKSVITSAAGQSRRNIIINFVNDDHDEADTLMIYHAVIATEQNQMVTKLFFFSPYTVVLVLSMAHYDR